MRALIPTDSWQVLQALHPNVLVVHRDPQQRMRTVEAIVDGTRAPVWRCDHRPLTLPADAVSTLVVPDVHSLTADEQRELLAWAERHNATQLVTASPEPLYPAVTAGRFLDGLYYRLNVLLIGDEDV